MKIEPTHDKTNKMICAPSKDSDQPMDAQADLSLHWEHRSFCWFCHEAAHLSERKHHHSSKKDYDIISFFSNHVSEFINLIKCVKLAWSLGFDLFRVRRVARARIWVAVYLGLG